MSKTKPAATNSQPVTETFEAEISSIKEKGKDLKGEQREFYASIVQRLENNVKVLSDLREEHKALRNNLGSLVKTMNSLSEESNLQEDIKRLNHEVNFLKRQIDKAVHNKEKSIARQKELEAIYSNLQNASETVHPEEARIHSMKNKLDKTNIKNDETSHLMKIYQQIIRQFDKQKMHYAPILRATQQQIDQAHRDIGDLTLIARDSRHSQNIARDEFLTTEAQINASEQRRRKILEAKKAQAATLQSQQIFQSKESSKPSRALHSLNSQSSVLRNRMNKAVREKREERFRQVSQTYDDIREHFGTNDSEKIQRFFEERRETSKNLQKQIEELKDKCSHLEAKASQLKSSIEEAEFASSRGVGGKRLINEGKVIYETKVHEVENEQNEISAIETHQRTVISAIMHIFEIMQLVCKVEIDTSDPAEVLNWCRNKCEEVTEALENEDTDFVEMVNRNAFKDYVERTEVPFNIEQIDSPRRNGKRADNHKRQSKETKNDTASRVLDRNAVKAMAARTVLASQQQKKRN
ncbi:hypothetical protein GPJ56_008192 [Histomonas meleagridis]|uniref:uncharacterized protein n=1 Tax=Histomonas meleagridis TaxID=135588 RepID=UPI00355A3424|nr:hypothetical protein GPJ56_008192 [Histomonas meleagridis]KAH0797213.1 hypothetical protein GO595_009895 [Histomonas meleagridis]